MANTSFGAPLDKAKGQATITIVMDDCEVGEDQVCIKHSFVLEFVGGKLRGGSHNFPPEHLQNAERIVNLLQMNLEGKAIPFRESTD